VLKIYVFCFFGDFLNGGEVSATRRGGTDGFAGALISDAGFVMIQNV
jgi:hypothetical protein